MLDAGWLAPARFRTVKTELGLADVDVSNSTRDLSATSLAGVMNTAAINARVERIYLDCASKLALVVPRRPCSSYVS